MSPPKQLINTFINDKIQSSVDTISKIFIKSEALFGLNRFNVLDEYTFSQKTLVSLYSIFLNITVIAGTIYCHLTSLNIGVIVDLFLYILCTIFTFLTCKRLELYFQEINNFDNEVRCTPKTSSFLRRNISLHIVIILVVITSVFSIAYRTLYSGTFKWQIIPFYITHILELYFYGHLFSLFIPRMKLINLYVGSAYITDNTVCRIPEGFKSLGQRETKKDFSEISFLMDLYEIITIAHSRLVNAIKWQFLAILITSFIASLAISYTFILMFLKNEVRSLPERSAWSVTSFLGLVAGNTLSLFIPCLHGDQVHHEVHTLRMLLAVRLNDGHMNKRSRGAARALLALTQQHDLSLSLLGMVKVDISLPLKYISLLLTYLIILLQFQKVIQS